jgi:hypothetical protein
MMNILGASVKLSAKLYELVCYIYIPFGIMNWPIKPQKF